MPESNPDRVENQLAAKRAAELPCIHDPILIGKVRRAYLKAKITASPEDQRTFLAQLLGRGIPVAHIGSRRIAKVLTGEITMDSLLKTRKPKT